MDCAIFKQRTFMLLYGCAFVVTCLFVIYQNSFGDNNKGIILFEQSEGIGSTYYKRYESAVFLSPIRFGIIYCKNTHLG